MIEQRGNGDWRVIQEPLLCVSWSWDLNCETQLLVPGRSPCPWRQATDCPNQGIPSTLPSIASSSSAHRYTHPVLAPLCIVLLLPRGQGEVGYSWDHGTLFPYKGLEGQHDTRCVSSIVLGVSADSLLGTRLTEWGMACDAWQQVWLLGGMFCCCAHLAILGLLSDTHVVSVCCP